MLSSWGEAREVGKTELSLPTATAVSCWRGSRRAVLGSLIALPLLAYGRSPWTSVIIRQGWVLRRGD